MSLVFRLAVVQFLSLQRGWYGVCEIITNRNDVVTYSTASVRTPCDSLGKLTRVGKEFLTQDKISLSGVQEITPVKGGSHMRPRMGFHLVLHGEYL